MSSDRPEMAPSDPSHVIVVATGNPHKVREIEQILSAVLPQVRFVAISELGEFPDPVEDGDTFRDNALIKARAAVAETGLAAIADDSGLVVDALDGRPGVLSARWAGVHGDDAANNAKLMREMEVVADADRTARFHCCVALVRADGSVLVGEGDCEGSVGHAPRGDGGFGYDPLFLPDATPGLTLAQVDPDTKNAISHRFHALRALADELEE
jgi:XTP/dITP diphosphohydrolase